jgi:hypothetical protein
VLKLYKRIDGDLHYHEAWAHKRLVYEHWGIVGDRGESKEHKIPKGKGEEDAIREVLRPAIDASFAPIHPDDHTGLVIQYRIEGHGTTRDISKLQALENRMSETLGWTGLGHCDGNSIGAGTMEVFCPVVDFEIAKQIVAEDLAGSEFDNYSRICRTEDLD